MNAKTPYLYLLIGFIIALLVVPAVSAYEYSIDYGPYFVTETGTGWLWWGPVYDVSPEYPLTDYNITFTPDWSGNTVGANWGAIHLRGYSGDTQIFAVFLEDLTNVFPPELTTQFRVTSAMNILYSEPNPQDYGNWSGTIQIVHRAPDIWEIWRDGSLLKSGQGSGSAGPLTKMTLEILRYQSNSYPSNLSVGSVSIHGVTDVPPTQPCIISVYDAVSHLPLSGAWDYYVMVQGGDDISGSGSGAFTPVNLPVTSIFQPHLLYVTKEGYEMTPGVVAVEVPVGGRQINIYMTPNETVVNPGFRTGSVIMTDHNGTPITGFEVKAVNHYTGEEYTASTDTDVATITLPMDRTIEIRNPQTGEYEEAPIGYYRFFGYKPGYRMLNEEGIKVSVMPEKYGSYKLCDILVSSDSGPLTGKHQFQIRSWSDNSVLQTGTISAKSRTTGIWYNTTVVDGIATLILPYDTSDALSEHAGHYYVYATSPGYEDNNYGVQIAVYPRTVSEIRSIHLYPIGGVPTPGNVTLRIQAISETGQSVANAEIFIAGVLGAGKDVWDTYTTSWTGFIEVSVPGNSTYDIVARGAGYYDSSRRIEVFTEDPPIIEMYLYLSGAPTVEPTTEPTGWVTGPPTTQPTGGIPDEDDDSDGFMMESVRGIANLFGVSFGTGKTILGMLLALGIGTATAKHLRGGAQEFGMGMLGGVVLGVLIGLLPIWVLVLLVLIVGLWIGQRYMSGGDS